MRFEASLRELQKAIKDLELQSKKVAKSKGKATVTNQIDMFGMGAPTPSNDIDVEAFKSQLDDAIASVETILKESA